MRTATSPSLAVKNIASPKGWSQKWAHEPSTTANHSEISTSKALRGLPWAQGVAGSNPVAPTTFRVPGFQRGSTHCALSGVTLPLSNSPTTQSRFQVAATGRHLPTVTHSLIADRPDALNQLPRHCQSNRDVNWV